MKGWLGGKHAFAAAFAVEFYIEAITSGLKRRMKKLYTNKSIPRELQTSHVVQVGERESTSLESKRGDVLSGSGEGWVCIDVHVGESIMIMFTEQP